MIVQDARWIDWYWLARQWSVAVALAVCAATAAAHLPHCAGQEPVTLQLRVRWGNGVPRAWRATAKLTSGSLSEPRLLGSAPDAPGSMWVDRGRLEIDQPTPRALDGVDITAQTHLHATLTIDITPQDEPTATRTLQVPITKLLANPSELEDYRLDEQGNTLSVRRAPGDRLRVHIERDSLVYWTGEALSFRLQPTLTGLPKADDYQLRAQLRLVESGTLIWETGQPLTLDVTGSAAMTDEIAVALEREGVYELTVGIHKKRSPLTTPLRNFQPFLSKPLKPALERKVQLVVVDAKRPEITPANWKLESEIDPRSTRWWESVIRLPQWRVFANLRKGQLGNAQPVTGQPVDEPYSQLSSGGWQAYPLTVRVPGKPHVLEIDYPANRKQLLSISIIEPTQESNGAYTTIDSGIHVTGDTGDESAVATHRLTFWPRSKSPLVLITNRHEKEAAVFGALRVYSNTSLPAHTETSGEAPQRLVAAYYDQPEFIRNFGVTATTAAQANRPITDWQTFYQGTRRFIEYLKYAGYNGAFVPVMVEGGTLYPSELLQPTTQVDSGLLADTGQDLQRKDVLELMMRLFDREGLRLIPVMQFATPLPELEALRRSNRANTNGIELIGSHGHSWMEGQRPATQLAPRYNPLNRKVQTAVRNVTNEVLQNYAQHDAFAGVAWQLTPQTFTHFPNGNWGYDTATVNAFLAETESTPPRRNGNVFQDRAFYLNNAGQARWLEWRAKKLTAFFDQVGSDIANQKSSARLFLTSANLLQGGLVEPQVRPQLPPQTNDREILLQIGLDIPRLQQLRSTSLLEPNLISHGQPASTQAGQDVLQREFASHAPKNVSGGTIYYQATPFSLPDYDQLSPLVSGKLATSLTPHIAESQHHQRKAWTAALQRGDRQILMTGGHMLTLGQEDSQRSFIKTFRQLPTVAFQDIVREENTSTIQPLIIRHAQAGEFHYLYLLNNSGWSVTANILLDTSPLAQLVALDERALQPLRVTGKDVEWTVPLKPYDMIAVRCSDTLKIQDVSVTTEQRVFEELSRKIEILRARVLASKATSDAIQITNAQFEQTQDGTPTDWLHAPLGPDGSLTVQVEADTAPQGKVLKLKSRGAVGWVRSEPLPSPKLGRLKLSVRLRTPEANRQPPIRLAIQGTVQGVEYYRYAQVGAGPAGTPQLTTEWKEFEILFDNLPLHDLKDLRVGIDLMGPGEVWVDDVRAHDTWFRKVERDELLKSVALARFHLRARHVSDCLAVLDGYWSRFLEETTTIDESRVKSPPPEATVEQEAEPPPAKPESEKPSGLRAWLPKFLR
ncbi:MAG TPA: hypothetical protein DCY79_18555 [Planctomycetaceae bacterium]|nr:hypothetical protein [Planctomycetaceae bacterium]